MIYADYIDFYSYRRKTFIIGYNFNTKRSYTSPEPSRNVLHGIRAKPTSGHL
jgi:hypothetical protein